MNEKIKMTKPHQRPLQKVCIVSAKGNLEDVYTALHLAKGAILEGIEVKMLFSSFGIDALVKRKMKYAKMPFTSIGNPALRFKNGMRIQNWLSVLPGFHSVLSKRLKSILHKNNIPEVNEFLEMITAGGGEIYACKLTMDMFGLKTDDLSEQVKAVISLSEFYEKAGGDGSQFIVV